ncbi:HEAT repeat domain-containing protein [Ktedonospora formicarum]|uniref:Leucine rich repeat variant n=1 Tax=Ktedonospora formicarum TaxID=2778364 RepID=A0A8J3I0W4_9CHLR|nr:hypothetical protein [Ktedonospora formicarum]GHO47279.1 hypothetical protein KSX_54420 [Ktedonospora formicarum]
MAWQFPQEFLHNPVVFLYLLAHPELMPTNRPTDHLFWEGLLRAAPLPPPWWDWFCKQPGYADTEMLRLHIQCNGEVDDFWRALQAESAPTLLPLIELLVLEERQASALLAAPTSVSLSQSENALEIAREETLWWLACHPQTQIRTLIASSTRVPTEILASMVQDLAWDVRRELACNQRTPVEVLVSLSRHADASTRSRVAENEHVPVETLYVLAQDRERFVREALLKNKQLPTEILARMAQDRDEEIRRQVASHPRTSADILGMLAQDRDEAVRRRVASHPQTSADVLWILAWDKSLEVRVAVAENELAPAALLEALMKGETLGETLGEIHFKMNVVGNLRVSVSLLRRHAQHEDQNVRRVIAEHPQTPPEILSQMCQDRDPFVQIAVAGNWQTPVDVLRTLAQHEFEGLKRWGLEALAQNIQTPFEVLQTLAQKTQHGPTRWSATFVSRLQVELGEHLDREEVGTILKDLFRTKRVDYPAIKEDSPEQQILTLALLKGSTLVRRAILTVLATEWDVSTMGELYESHPYSWWVGQPDTGFNLLSPEVLQKLALAPKWKVRFLVASHEQTSELTRQCLSQDGNRYVRAIARAKAAHMGESASSE